MGVRDIVLPPIPTESPSRTNEVASSSVDQAIPRRYAVHETAPEPLGLSAIEIVDRHALLFHPGVISEIEDTLAIEMREFEDVIVHDTFQVAAEDLAGVDLVESIPIAARQKAASFAGIEQRAVGRHRHDHVVGVEIKMFGDLYGGDDIGKPRDADVVEGSHHIRVDLSPPRQIAAPDIASEQEIE